MAKSYLSSEAVVVNASGRRLGPEESEYDLARLKRAAEGRSFVDAIGMVYVCSRVSHVFV